MKSTEYREQVYRLGLPTRIKQIEDELASYHADYPELFLTDTPPQLLRPERKRGAVVAPTNGAAPHGQQHQEKIHTRAQTEEVLNWIGIKPRHREDIKRHGVDMRGLYQFERNDYITRKGDVYTRTRKPFLVSTYAAKIAKQKPGPKPKRKKDESASAVAARRQRSFDALNLIKADGPMKDDALAAKGISVRAILPLVRRGYLRHTTAGYTRTSKEFDVKKR